MPCVLTVVVLLKEIVGVPPETVGVIVPSVTTVVPVDGVKHAMTEIVTSRGGWPSDVVNVIVIVLFSGSSLNDGGVAVVEPAGDVNVKMTLPLGPVTVTVMESTFVVGLGTEIEASTGVRPGAIGMVTDAVVASMKSTPGAPGVRSAGDVPCGAPMRTGVPRLVCSPSMPTCVA